MKINYCKPFSGLQEKKLGLHRNRNALRKQNYF